MAQKVPKLTPAIGYAATALVDQSRPPAHDQLTRLFRRTGLAAGDPGSGEGKVKRTRAVVDYALAKDRSAGARMVLGLIELVRAGGGFRRQSNTYIGDPVYINLRDAFRERNFELDPDGQLRPRLLESVPSAEQDEVLATYVRRIREGATDAPLVTGSGKDLLEATANRVLERNGESYAGKDFPGTLFHAFRSAGLPPPSGKLVKTAQAEFDSDPRAAMKQALYLLGCEVNRLRNQEGTGHGRAFLPSVTDREARLAAQAMALISELLLAEHDDQPAFGSRAA
jgi:hypothetical protein